MSLIFKGTLVANDISSDRPFDLTTLKKATQLSSANLKTGKKDTTCYAENIYVIFFSVGYCWLPIDIPI